MYPRLRIAVVACALALAASGVACQNDDPEVRVRVCGDVSVPRPVDGVRISLIGPEGDARREAVLDLLECPGGNVRSLPQSVSFRPFEGEARAVAQGLDDGQSVVRYERRLTLSGDDSTTVTLALNRDCLDYDCPRGQTCIGGECRVALREDSRPTRCHAAQDTVTLGDVGPDAADALDTASGSESDVEPADTGTFNPATLCPGFEPDDAGDSYDLDGDDL